MAINRGDHKFIGTRNVLTGYMAGGQNIVRSRSSLTGERVKNDPAFDGFRESCNRMTKASALASSLYNQIPKELKRFSLYRQLTGEALKMLKQGKDQTDIVEKLQALYIAPLLEQPVKQNPPTPSNGFR